MTRPVIAGYRPTFAYQYPGPNQNSGPFCGIATLVKMASIVDGTSNTIGFAEIVTGVGATASVFDNLKPTGSPSQLQTTVSGSAMVVGTPAADYTNCNALAPSTTSVTVNGNGDWPLGAAWWWGRSGQTRYVGVMPPSTWSCSYKGDNSDSDADAVSAAGRHPGGANVAMLDGSVRFIKSSISTPTWWGLHTMLGGEVISSDQY